MSGDRPEASRFRMLSGWLSVLTRTLLIAIPLVGIFFIMDAPSYLGRSILIEQYYGLFLAMVLASVFLLVPPTQGSARDRVPWYDAVMAILGVAVGLYVAILYPEILWSIGTITLERIVMSTIAVVLVLEAVRRLTGWFLLVVGLVFIMYGRFTWLVPGVFHGPGIPWDELFISLYLDSNAMLGIPMMVTSVIVLGYILFGNLLFAVGGGEFLTNVALAGFGRFRGGPAKIAVVASSLFGTVSGSAVSNVVTTGTMTIPLMKRTGYRPHLAAAIEAVASTGGQLMPPIMGAAAFIIAEYTQIPYPKVAVAAFIPAVLYYAAVFIQVDLEAGRAGLKGLPRDQLPSVKPILGQSYLFVVPLGALIYALFVRNLAPGKAALIGVASVVLVGFVRSQTRFRLRWILDALEKTGRALLELTIIVALAGFIIGIIAFSGAGFILPLVLGKIAGGNVFLLLLIIAVVGIILGMGMPTVGVYILLAVLMAPALIEMGVEVLAAHLFILYYGVLSMITPPICFASFAAAALAGSDSMKTGYTAMRLGSLAYIVPLLFIFSQTLLLMGPVINIIISVFTAIAGCFLLGVALVGYLFQNLSLPVRGLAAIAGICLLIPMQSQFVFLTIISNLIGGGLALILLWHEWRLGFPPRRHVEKGCRG